MEPVISPIALSNASSSPELSPGASQPEGLGSLRRFARPPSAAERCDLCGIGLTAEHQHLLDRGRRQIACSCDACAILFCGQQGAKFFRIPRRIVRLDGFSFTDAQWDVMTLPINLAFFLRQPDGKTAAMYPSPAGVMESLIALPAWSALFDGQPTISAIEPEVEALLVNRIGDQAAYFIVPIDACYRLVGLIRTKWHGLSGGQDVWNAIAEFFAQLDRHAFRAAEDTHA